MLHIHDFHSSWRRAVSLAPCHDGFVSPHPSPTARLAPGALEVGGTTVLLIPVTCESVCLEQVTMKVFYTH